MQDWLIVGCGLFGAVVARELLDKGKSVLIIDKRSHVGGNVYTRRENSIDIHAYGPHIFHTNNKSVWDYINQFGKFNNYIHKVKAISNNKLYSLPINLSTFYEVLGLKTPLEVKKYLELQQGDDSSLESWCLKHVGKEIYETLIKGYTKKQWNKNPSQLPSSIIRRLPIRMNFDDNYHRSAYQGIPVDGYTKIVENLIHGADLELETSKIKPAKNILYTGPIDKFFDYCHGKLEYRSLRFENNWYLGDHQGISQINYCDESVGYTRKIEHKHFVFGKQENTCVTTEYPANYEETGEPYYPVNDKINQDRYLKYRKLVSGNVFVEGRMGRYSYFDMDQTVASARKFSEKV